MPKGWRREGGALIVDDPERAARLLEAHPGLAAVALIPGAALLRFDDAGRPACRECGAKGEPHRLAAGRAVLLHVPHEPECASGDVLRRLTAAIYGEERLGVRARRRLLEEYEQLAATYAQAVEGNA